MKISLKQLIAGIDGDSHPNHVGALTKLANDNGLPVKTLFRLKKIWKSALDEYRAFNEIRKKLCETHGTLEEGATEYTFETPEKREEFDQEFNSLLEVEVELPGPPFTNDDFFPRKMTAGEFLSANDLISLEWLIVDEAPVEVPQQQKAAASNN